jgi:DNA invertase Pin-like site-specific DNA recombinase
LVHFLEGHGVIHVWDDLPTVPPGTVGKFLVTQMATVTELEAGLISQRTRAALAMAKMRGGVLVTRACAPARLTRRARRRR